MATLANNFCIAPFTQLTFSPTGSYSPCPEIGGRPWKDDTISPTAMWNSNKFVGLRDSFLNNKKNVLCNRCWDQENTGNNSLRKRLLVDGALKKFKSGELISFLENGYQQGPKQFNIMVGNKCNLRCRVCSAGSSSTFNVEGNYYKNKNNLEKLIYVSENPEPVEFNEKQINEIFQLSGNLERIEFYGGEPILDIPTITLLKKLVESGQSKNITLFYNTNGIAKPKKVHFDLWNQFEKIEFNISIDDIGDRFTYHRHPGKWKNLLDNIDNLRSYPWTVPVDFYSICTVSNLNIFYIPEILDELDKLNLPSFLNNVFGPPYYDITHLPSAIKLKIINKLKVYHNITKIQFLINMLGATENLDHWQQFKFWTREKDAYRKENFSTVYPEFYKILKEYDPTI
jgi:hypothetical protein